MLHRRLLVLPAALAVAALSACASAPAASEPAEDAGHGAIAGAAEVAEPSLALLSVSADGEVGMLDLLDGSTVAIGAVGAPRALSSDGRYGFVATDAGLEVVDSGRWTWDHVDHFHYYRADPRVVGAVEGGGIPIVTNGLLSTAGSTGVLFPESGEAVLLDNAALSDGDVVETFRIEVGADAGGVAPLHDGALVAADGEIVFHDGDGSAADSRTACADPAGAITTRVGVVIGCADGAVLATWDDGPVFERIAYPDAQVARATEFAGRKGRPTVAAVAEESGYWLLDTRERTWTLVETPPLAHVAAVDDADGHVVAIDAAGAVRVYDATGAELAATAPLVTAGDAAFLTVDAQRAYVSDPAAGTVLEIDFADAARVARTLTPATAPAFVAEVGR